MDDGVGAKRVCSPEHPRTCCTVGEGCVTHANSEEALVFAQTLTSIRLYSEEFMLGQGKVLGGNRKNDNDGRRIIMLRDWIKTCQ